MPFRGALELSYPVPETCHHSSACLACFSRQADSSRLAALLALSLSKHQRLDTRELESSPPPNVPYSLALFLASPKKKGEKEGRRSARGRFFRE